MDCFDTITIFDALDLKVSAKFCIEDSIGLLVRSVGCTGLEKRGKLNFKQLCVGHLFEKG